ncbi:MAG TPA: hypothetical protein VFV74_00305 [Burkholderiales bacterium]|nr:hypothetical protein [Burkholderiales bacterium]
MQTRALFGTLRVLGFVVLAVLAVALVYALAISLRYYSGIGV